MLIGVVSMRVLPQFLNANADETKAMAFLFGLGALVVSVFALILLVEIIAAIALLRGSPTARVVLIIFSW